MIDQAITALQQDLAQLVGLRQIPLDEQSAALQLARLQAAQAALKLAAVLLEESDTTAAQPIWQEFTAVAQDLATWRRSGRGWFEERIVRRGTKTYGPYRYFRWRDEQGTTHTQYLGRIEQAATTTQPDPMPPVSVEAADPVPWRGTVQPVLLGGRTKADLVVPEGDGTTTLCGRAVGGDAAQTFFFRYNDCARCRTAATRLGRVCAQCGEPLILQDAPGLCHGCTVEGRRTR